MRPYDYNLENRDLTQRHFETLFPSLRGIRIAQTWGGAISFTMDMIPHIGFVGDERVLISNGCAGHGAALAQLNGRTLAELIQDKDTERTRFWMVKRKPLKWPPQPLGAIGLKSIVGLMKLEDRLAIRNTPLNAV